MFHFVINVSHEASRKDDYMSVKYENECCDCAVPGYPCMGSSCPNRNVPHYFCDKCGGETTLYEKDGEQLCADCVLKDFEIVEGSEE